MIIYHHTLNTALQFNSNQTLSAFLRPLFQVNPGWPVLLKLRMMEMVMTTRAIRRAKLQTNRHQQQNSAQLFTGPMPFLPPNQSTEGKLFQKSNCQNNTKYIIIIIIIIIINVLIKVTLNEEIRCRGTLQSQWSTLTESTSRKAEESVNVTDESRTSWYSSWNRTGGSSDDGRRWRQTRRSEWKRVGDSMILPLLRETSGRRELIAVWAERSATGCRLNAGDDTTQ